MNDDYFAGLHRRATSSAKADGKEGTPILSPENVFVVDDQGQYVVRGPDVRDIPSPAMAELLRKHGYQEGCGYRDAGNTKPQGVRMKAG